jgi:hypothetical protein
MVPSGAVRRAPPRIERDSGQATLLMRSLADSFALLADAAGGSPREGGAMNESLRAAEAAVSTWLQRWGGRLRRPGAGARRRIGLVLVPLLAVGWGLGASAAGWLPNETQVSAQPDLIDFEFSQSRAQICWNDETGHLWIGNVDRATGAFVPADGKGILVDSDAMRFDDAQKTKNGPEWVSTAQGDFIVYTKYVGYHTDGNSRLGLAQTAPNGQWYRGLLGPDYARKGPYGSATPGDPAPRITYVDNRENHYWRELWNQSTEQPLADIPASNYPVRHVVGARALVYPLTVGTVDQAFYRDLDTGNKYEIWMWRAPEYGNEFVFMTLVDQVELRVYRKLAGADGQLRWTAIYSRMAPDGNKIFSPEPFTYAGHSYIFMAQSVRPNKFHSEIWIANIDMATPLFRRISDNTLLRTRTDPEVFITDAGPMIYYNRLIPDDGLLRAKACRSLSCSEGVFRSDPGITAAGAAN